MARWFLSTRVYKHGGPVARNVHVLDADRLGYTGDLTPELLDDIHGREVYLGVHGFEVNQPDGIEELSDWFHNLDIGNAVPIGILWPGDCIIPLFVDYIVEGRDAIQSGKLLAAFLNTKFTGAVSISFASHSLGARVVLQTIAGLAQGLRVRRVLLMAGAIDDNCLTGEYRRATDKIDEISILASKRDDVLAWAYPLGNPLQGIIDSGHPYYHAALGRTGPAMPYPPGPRLQPNWQIPSNLAYGHHNYLPKKQLAGRYSPPVDIPPTNGPNPPAGTPAALATNDLWKPAWSAAFASTRYQR
jgi:hypothetical protein